MRLKSKQNAVYANIYVKRRLFALRLSVLGQILYDLKMGTPKFLVLKRVKGQIWALGQEINLSLAEMNRIYSEIYSQYYDLRRKYHFKKDATDEEKHQKLYMSIRAKILKGDLEKSTNMMMYQVEYRQKHDYVYGKGGIIDAARSSSRAYSPFFLASSHPKPAKDHAAWEGKMYYDEAWERYVDDPELRDHIRAYIRNHKLLTVQFVLGPEVYFVLRRNCKHYLKNIPLEEVLHASAKSLLKKHHMYHEDKDEPASEAALRYRQYKERLQVLEVLQKEIPNKILRQDIYKNKILLDKYLKML